MVIIVSQYAKSLSHLSWRLLKGFSVRLSHLGAGKSLTIITHLILVKSTSVASQGSAEYQPFAEALRNDRACSAT